MRKVCQHTNKQYWWFSTDEINPKDSRPVHYWKCPDCGEFENVSKEEFMKHQNLNR